MYHVQLDKVEHTLCKYINVSSFHCYVQVDCSMFIPTAHLTAYLDQQLLATYESVIRDAEVHCIGHHQLVSILLGIPNSTVFI